MLSAVPLYCWNTVLLEHCADDPLVLIESGRDLRETLRGFGAKVKWNEYPSGGHWFHSPNGADDAVDFLRSHILGEGVEGAAVGRRRG